MNQLDHVFFAGVASATNRSARRSVAVPVWCPTSKEWTGFERDRNEELNPFLGWLLSKAGVSAKAYKSSALQRRLPSCLRAVGAGSPAEAKEALTRNSRLLPPALSSVLIGVSSFFRDPDVFRTLHESVLPGLLLRRAAPRVLSAGCSDGQELYSLAMVLDALGVLEQSVLCGCDCRPDALSRAALGTYPMADLREMDLRWLDNFHSRRNFAQVRFRIRQRLHWLQLNLLAFDHESKWDVVLFRNVAIYMDPARVWDLWLRMVRAIAPGGLLVTGKAEKPPPNLNLERVAGCIYRKISPLRASAALNLRA